MSNKEVNRTTPREFDLRLQGIERERKEKELLLLEEWRRARFIAFTSIQPHLSKEHHNLSIYDFFPLPGDPTPEERVKARLIEEPKQKSEGAAIMEMYRALKKGELIDSENTK